MTVIITTYVPNEILYNRAFKRVRLRDPKKLGTTVL